MDTGHDPVVDARLLLDHARTRLAAHLERGASLVEYALLVALIAIVCIGAINIFGGAVDSSINTSTSSLFSP